MLEVNAAELKSKLVDSFLDIISDFAVETIEDLESQVSAFKECLELIRTNSWRRLFADGWTMMMLDNDSMEYVENFFDKKRKHSYEKKYTEIEIIVKCENGDSYIIEERDINF